MVVVRSSGKRATAKFFGCPHRGGEPQRLIQMAKKQQTVAEQLAEVRCRHDEEERRERELTITEFSAEAGSSDPEAVIHAMAGAILTCRRALKQR
jgi:AraC-like DNA-binding protein